MLTEGERYFLNQMSNEPTPRKYIKQMNPKDSFKSYLTYFKRCGLIENVILNNKRKSFRGRLYKDIHRNKISAYKLTPKGLEFKRLYNGKLH